MTILLLLAVVKIVKAQEWQTSFEKSIEVAKKENRNIVLVFSGSDWCVPCIKLENEILDSEAFKTYAKDNFVLLKADFPRKKKNQLPNAQQDQNNMLAEKYNKQGYFPLIVVLDYNGNILGVTGYKKVSPREFITILSSY